MTIAEAKSSIYDA